MLKAINIAPDIVRNASNNPEKITTTKSIAIPQQFTCTCFETASTLFFFNTKNTLVSQNTTIGNTTIARNTPIICCI